MLEKIYRLHDKVLDGDFACKPHCSACCTRNVTLTTLEGICLIDHVKQTDQPRLLDDIRADEQLNRFYPKTTTNRIAELCAKGLDIPDETTDPAWGSCPLLKNGMCAVYQARPLNCRCLVSRKDCSTIGYAEMDPFTLTLNNLFAQFTEHLDCNGLTGNLTDVLLYLESDPHHLFYRSRDPAPDALVHNYPIRTVMIPPEHRERVKAIHALLRDMVP